jgi:hypothetical protein
LENRACGPALCMFSMWHRHTPCRRACPILRFPMVWVTGSGAWPCGYSLKEGSVPSPTSAAIPRRHPVRDPRSLGDSAGKYEGDFDVPNGSEDRFTQESYKSLKKHERISVLSPVSAKPSPPLPRNVPFATGISTAQEADRHKGRRPSCFARSACFAGLGNSFCYPCQRYSLKGSIIGHPILRSTRSGRRRTSRHPSFLVRLLLSGIKARTSDWLCCPE